MDLTVSYHVVENMNSRTAEQGTAEYRSEKKFRSVGKCVQHPDAKLTTRCWNRSKDIRRLKRWMTGFLSSWSRPAGGCRFLANQNFWHSP